MVMLRYGFWVLALVWMPLGVVAMAGLHITLDPNATNINAEPLFPLKTLTLLIVAPTGLPLALACRLLWRRGRHSGAVWSWIIAGVLSIAASIYAEYAGLSGPLAIAIATAVLSLPVWAMVARMTPDAAAKD